MIDNQAKRGVQLLGRENKELKTRILKLEEAISLLEETNKKLLEENLQLKERLGLNSTN